jgi:hypothetical protein
MTTTAILYFPRQRRVSPALRAFVVPLLGVFRLLSLER